MKRNLNKFKTMRQSARARFSNARQKLGLAALAAGGSAANLGRVNFPTSSNQSLFECLESRTLLSADPVISEFLASNGNGLVDGNGVKSDWIEIENKGDAAINLTGWHLTDDPLKLDKWTFPSKTLNAGQFLVVFASGNNAVDPAGNLHTNFALNADGEYLALTRPNLSIATEFGPGGTNYPKQLQDVSYGPGTVLDQTTLLSPSAPAKAIVPTNNSLDNLSWVAPGFNDSSWTSGTTGVGFDTGAFEDVQPPPTLKAQWIADDLSSTLSSGQAISTWADDVHGKSATAAGQVILQKNIINGHAVARFNPADGNDLLRVLAADNPMSGIEDFTVAVVFRTSVAGAGSASSWFNNSGIVDGAQVGINNDWGLSINSSGQIGAGLGAPDVTAYSASGKANGAAHVAVYTHIDNGVNLYVDGGDSVATAGGDSARAAADMVFGALQSGGGYFNGDIAQIIIYSGGVDANSAYNIASGLGSKYAITVAAPTPGGAAPALLAKWTADDLNAQADGSTVNTWNSSVGSASATRSGAPKLAKNQLNGHSVVHFNPADGNDQLRVAAAVNPMANRGDFSLAVVFRTGSPGLGAAGQWYNNSGIVDAEIGGVTNDWGLVIDSAGQVGAGLGQPDTTVYSNPGLADGNAHVAVYTRIGADFKLYIDGSVAYEGTGATATRANADMVFGSLQTNLDYYNGDIAEVQVYGGALSEAGEAQLENQLATKYAVAQPPATYNSLIGLDLESQMSGLRTTADIRIPFTVSNASDFDSLWLNMQYDDGFVAYLNGVEVARRNAPASVTFSSTASAPRADSQALVPEQIDISSFVHLLQNGNNVLAIEALNSAATDPDLLIIPEIVAAKTLASTVYYSTPTPGAANGTGFIDYVRDVHFSIVRGLFSSPFTLDISDPTPGATIVYTTDGSVPTLTHGTVVNAADANTPPVAHVNINATTTLRASAFRNTYLPTNVDTETYVLTASVLTQPNVAPAGAYWDTAMDPRVVNAAQTYTVTQALSAIPTISLVLPDADMFGPNGIYANPYSKGIAWERETSVEYFDPNNPNSEFQLDAGIRIQGGVDRDPSRPKKSFRLFFRSDYGAGKLNFPIFGSDYPVSSFDTLILKGGHNYNWANAGGTPVSAGDYLRDQFARDTQADMDGLSTHGTFVQLYINGLYWGEYEVTEEPDESWAAAHLGGSRSDYDVLQPNVDGSLSLLSGDLNVWNSMFSTADAAMADGSINNTEYANISQYVDVTNLADYMLNIIYRQDQDAPVLIGSSTQPRNFYAIRPRSAGGKFFFETWDGEISLDNVNYDRTEISGNFNPARLYQQLRTNAEFRQLVADRVYKFFYNGGALTPQATAARYQNLVNQINVSIVGESARWGDAQRPSQPAMRDTDWLTEINSLFNSYFPQRTGIVLNQLKADFTVLNTLPPQPKINGTLQHGGTVAAGSTLSLFDPNAPGGTIYYTLDGSDPRLVGGAISPSAILYSGAFVVNQNVTVNMRIKNGTVWSPIDNVSFTIHTLAAPGNLSIDEVNYDPAPPTPAELQIDPNFTNDDFEFIELVNTSLTTVDLLNTHFDSGVTFNFGNTFIAPGQRAVLVKNIAAFQARYGTAIAIAGTYTGSLSNSGELLRLRAANNGILTSFTYSPNGNWPGRAAGNGSSLEVISTTGDYTNPANWRSSYEYGGTPGSAGAGAQNDVVINEVLTNTPAPSQDAIELHNTTANPIDISGWFLSDANSNYKKYRVPDGTIIPAGGYKVFTETDFNPTPQAPGPNDFALDGAHGDDVYLIKAAPSSQLLAFADAVHFGAAAQGESLGRWPNDSGALYPMATPTLGAANSGPRIGPVLITELMYHPQNSDPNLEYIEIQNITAAPLDISGWKFDNGVNFVFAAGTVLAAHQPLVVVPFDPSNAALLADFRIAYGIDASVMIVGPYTGALSDTGEKVQIVRPDTPPIDDPTFTPYVLVDEVDYGIAAPWPVSPAAGAGQSLSRTTLATYGDDPTSWAGQAPTVGSVPFGQAYFQGGIQYNYGASVTLDSLTVAPTASVTLTAGGSKFLRTGALDIQAGGKLDLNDGYLIIDTAPAAKAAALAQLTAALRSAYNPTGAHWTGSGLTSTTARTTTSTGLGVLLNDGASGLPIVSTFDGQSVTSNSILVRYTLLGDTDLDADVDSIDLAQLTRNITTPATSWATGDFNYDGKSDIFDFQRIEITFGTSLPAPAPAPVSSPAPTVSIPKPVVKPPPVRALKVTPPPPPLKPMAATFSTTPIKAAKVH